MAWGDDWNGGPNHTGICPECGKSNGDCFDGLCTKCENINENSNASQCYDELDLDELT